MLARPYYAFCHESYLKIISIIMGSSKTHGPGFFVFIPNGNGIKSELNLGDYYEKENPDAFF